MQATAFPSTPAPTTQPPEPEEPFVSLRSTPNSACLRYPPLTVRFFQDAVKFNVFTNAEAQEISFLVALCCQKHGQDYSGAFSADLSSGIFGDFLSSGMTRDGFLYRESVYGWCVDAFAAQLPWPVMPDFHLRLTGYRPARLSRQRILGRGRGPFLRFVNAIDIAAFAACGGLSVKSVFAGSFVAQRRFQRRRSVGHYSRSIRGVGAARTAVLFLRFPGRSLWFLHRA